MTETALGSRFLRGVRREFRPLFEDYGFVEVSVDNNLTFAAVVLTNATHYRTRRDFLAWSRRLDSNRDLRLARRQV
jgi:hypothetical protein